MDSQILMYQSMDGFTKIETKFNEETVWLSIEQMAELFQSDTTTILRLIKNIFSEEELIQAAVTADFASTTKDNKIYQVKHYNLDVIISVGYRVKTLRGTQFRLWASGILKEYLKKGFAFNDEIIENNGKVTYFDKLIERIHDIRLTENVFWRKVLDIYSTSIDYDPKAEYSILLFKMVQNKKYWVLNGQDAAGIVKFSVGATKPYIELYNFKGVQSEQVDTLIVKSCCSEVEMAALDYIVSAYLDFAEIQAQRRIPMYMGDWNKILDGFLKLSKSEILTYAGEIRTWMDEIKG